MDGLRLHLHVMVLVFPVQDFIHLHVLFDLIHEVLFELLIVSLIVLAGVLGVSHLVL